MKETGLCCAFPPIGPHLLRIIFRTGPQDSAIRPRGVRAPAPTRSRLALAPDLPGRSGWWFELTCPSQLLITVMSTPALN